MNTLLNKKNTCIVIAGDIFHDARREGKLSPNAMLLFTDFIENLNAFGTVVIIPGNHDNNITYQNSEDTTKVDSLTSVLDKIKGKNKTIFYVKDTGKYKLGNIIFYHTSVFDIDKIDKQSQYEDRLKYLVKRTDQYPNCKHICLLHGSIQSQKLQNGWVMKDTTFKLSDIEEYDISCLGDTHEQQFLGDKNNAAYPSSLVQQNHGESIQKHGYVIWDLETNIGTFEEIQNEYGFVTINSVSDIDKITYWPKKSRIKFRQSCDDSVNTEDIRNLISKKTTIISFKKEMTFASVNQIDECAVNDINDDEKLLKYIHTQILDDDAKCTMLHAKIMKEIAKYHTVVGGTSCNLTKLSITDFQCYTGEHTIDFTQYQQNSTISINGNNATGKSTIIRALDLVIWGPEKGNAESYFNNQTNVNCKCVIEFQHDYKIYKLTRILARKGTNKHECKLEEYKNDQWNNITNKYIKSTQLQVERFFGTREDAGDTWLRQQDYSSTFINSPKNYLTFQRFIGSDIFEKIYTNSKKDRRVQEGALKILHARKDTIHISPEDINLDQDLSELEISKKNKEAILISLKKELKKESNKKEFGTLVDKTRWEEDLSEEEATLLELENNLIGMDDYELRKTHIDQEILALSTKKEALSKSLPPPPTEQYANSTETVEDIDAVLCKINSSLSTTDLLMGEIDNEIGRIVEKQTVESDKKTQYDLLSNSIKTKQDELSKISINLDKYEGWKTAIVEVNVAIAANNAILGPDYKQDDKVLVRFQSEHAKLQLKRTEYEKQIKELDNNIRETSGKIIELPSPSAIEKGYGKLCSSREALKDKMSCKKTIQQNYDTAQHNLEKYTELAFDSECSCCDDNKSHFKIDDAEETVQDCAAKLAKSIESIQKSKKRIDKYSIYDAHYTDSNNNNKYILENKMSRSKLENSNLKLNTVCKDIQETDDNLKKYTANSAIVLANNNLLKRKTLLAKKIAKMVKKIDKDSGLKSSILQDEHKLEFIDYSNERMEELTEQLKEYKQIKSLYEQKKSLHEQKDSIKQAIEYALINIKIEAIKKSIGSSQVELGKLQQDYQKECDSKKQIVNIALHVADLKSKITKYNKKGGYDSNKITELDNAICSAELEKETITESIGKTKNYLEIYSRDKKAKEELWSEITTKEVELNKLKEYQNIVDPINGYPNELIKSSLETFTKQVNVFVKSAGFDYTTTIKAPEESVNRQSQKMIFIYKKNGLIFSVLSGAENFILNAAILSVLGSILNMTTPPLLVIDEGFSVLDKDHIEGLPILLNFIKTKFNYILYISHNDDIKGMGDYNILVEKVLGKSKISGVNN
jgi:DNA repair exonuclease SbcCD ATPase subunit